MTHNRLRPYRPRTTSASRASNKTTSWPAQPLTTTTQTSHLASSPWEPRYVVRFGLGCIGIHPHGRRHIPGQIGTIADLALSCLPVVRQRGCARRRCTIHAIRDIKADPRRSERAGTNTATLLLHLTVSAAHIQSTIQHTHLSVEDADSELHAPNLAHVDSPEDRIGGDPPPSVQRALR